MSETPEDTFSLQRVAVTGAGQMGAQIAMLAALGGFETRLHDIDTTQTERAIDTNRKHVGRRVEKGKLAQEAMDEAFDRLSVARSLEEACDGVDFVLEAVVEKLDVKRQVFARLDELAPEGAILATNSSYLASSRIADATKRPDRVLNMHFFYPPLVMRLVEVVQGPHTSDETTATTMELARRMGKVPVHLRKEMPGFLVNRILRAISNEAYALLENGVASFADIDRACEMGLNHPMGPFKLGDYSGLDIGYNARLEVFRETGRPEDEPPKALALRVERGDLGRKTKRGFYDWTGDRPRPTED